MLFFHFTDPETSYLAFDHSVSTLQDIQAHLDELPRRIQDGRAHYAERERRCFKGEEVESEPTEEKRKSPSELREGAPLPKLYLLMNIRHEDLTKVAREGVEHVENESEIPDAERHAVLVYIRNISPGHGTEVNRICKTPIHLIQVCAVTVPRRLEGGDEGSESRNQISFLFQYITT